MIYLYVVLGILIALILFVLFVPVRLFIEYQNKQLRIELWVLKFKLDLRKLKGKKAKKTKQKTDSTDKELSFFNKINNTYKKVVYFKNVYNATSKHISKRFITKEIKADINFGFTDGAVTGIVTGIIWGVLYEFLGLLTLISTVKKHKFNVDAVYDRFVFDPRFSVTFKITILGAVSILISVLYNLKKYKE